MNELIRELVEALEYSSAVSNEILLAKARAYLETGGWTRVEDGLPVVPDGKKSVAIYAASYGLVLRTHATAAYPLGVLVGVTHWRYAEPTPEPPKG